MSKSVWDGIAALPEGFCLKVCTETDVETEESYLVAYIIQEPPDGGWETGCDYFGHVPSVHDAEKKCGWAVADFPWKNDEAVRVGTNAQTPKDLKENVKKMVEYWLSKYGGG